MNKLLGTLAIVSIVTSQSVQADFAGFEVGTSSWSPDYSGILASASDAGVAGDSINIQDDLGYSDESHNIVYALLEHPVPFLPNVKIVSSDLAASADSTITRDIVFRGTTFNVTDQVASSFDLSNVEYTLYYEILDNWLNLDLGLTIRQYDGDVSLSTTTLSESEKLDFSIPLLYVSARADLPFTGFFVDAQINTISAGDDSITDTAFGLGYESEIGLGVKLGYRTFSLDVEDDSFTGDLEFDGSYFNIFYHF